MGSATGSVYSSNDSRAQDRAWIRSEGGMDGIRETATKRLEKGREDKQEREREREKSINLLLVMRRNFNFQGQIRL